MGPTIRLFRALTILVIFCVNFLAFSKAATIATANSEKTPTVSESVILTGRENLKYQVVAQPIGFGPIPMYSMGVIAGYFADANSLITLEYTKGVDIQSRGYSGSDGNGHPKSGSTDYWNQSIDAYTIGVHYKKFVARSFYVKGGLDYRSFSKSHNYEPLNGTEERQTSSFSGHSYTGAVVVGNQWHRSHFTFGIDWIGYVFPLTSNVDSQSISSNAKSYLKESLEEDKDNYLAKPNLEFLKLYLGLSF